MSFKWNPSSGPLRSPLPSHLRSPQRWRPSSDRIDRYSAKVKARYILTPSGLVAVPRSEPEPEPEPIAPAIMAAAPLVAAIESRDDDEDYAEDDGGTMPASVPVALIAGPVIGWRMWQVAKDGELRSLTFEKAWPPGRAVVGDPTLDNRAGVYAMKHRDRLRDDGYGKHDTVLGKVALWGRVFEHEHGYRAQFGYPLEIDMRMDDPMPGFPRSPYVNELADQIRRRYGCVVLTGPISDRMERHIARD